MKKSIINFFLWFATPFVVNFFLILLLSNSTPAFNIITLLRLNIFLVLLPLFVYWTSSIYFKTDYHRREQISVVSLLSAMIYIYIEDISKLDSWLIIVYSIYFLSVLLFFITSFSKLNQYVVLVASFLVVLSVMMILLQKDLHIYILLLFSGFLMFLFVENEMDSIKNISFSYGIGFVSALVFTFLIFLLDAFNLQIFI